MYISDELKFCFVHIPKTGGTSIKKALHPWANKNQIEFDGENVTDQHGWHPHKPLSINERKKYADHFFFTIVRNPWSMHASMWKFLKARDSIDVKGLSFERYIDLVSRGKHVYSRNYSYYLNCPGWMDYIGRYETLQLSFDFICDRMGIDAIELPHYKNQGEYDYREMYTNKMKDQLFRFHYEDITQFKYEF